MEKWHPFMEKVYKVCPDRAAYRWCRSFKFETAPCTNICSWELLKSDVLRHQCPCSSWWTVLQRGTGESAWKGEEYPAQCQISGGFTGRSFLCRQWRTTAISSKLLDEWQMFLRLHFLQQKQPVLSFPSCCHSSWLWPKGSSGMQGQSINKVTASTAPKNVGRKAPSRKHLLDDDVVGSSSQVENRAPPSHFQAEVLNPTTLVIRKSARPDDPPSTAPIVLKEIKGNIRRCAGCLKPIMSAVAGYHDADDQRCCFARFEAYHFWRK